MSSWPAGAEPAPALRSRLHLGLGLALVLGGVAVGAWVVSLTHTALYHPEEMPILHGLLRAIRSADGAPRMLEAVASEETITVTLSGAVSGVLIGLFALVLVLALGHVVQALIAGGVKLLGQAIDRESLSARHRG